MNKLAILGVMAMVITGCAKDKTTNVPKNPDVVAVAPAPEPAPQPVIYDGPTAPVAQAAPTPVVPMAPAASRTYRTYVVKKGDTLFGIAKANYGSGKEWQKITSANPGLEPGKLKAGQKIMLP